MDQGIARNAREGAEQVADTDLNLNENESVSRFVAYASPYLFWTTVVGLSAGLLMMQ